MNSRAVRVGVWLLLLALGLLYAASRLAVDSDFSAFLPGGLSDSQRIFVKQLREGAASRLLLIELSNDQPQRLAALSKMMVDALARDPAFRYVNNGSLALAQREWATIERFRYVLSDRVTSARFAPAELREALTNRLEELSGATGAFTKPLLTRDPTGEALYVLARLTPSSQPRRVDDIWFDATGRKALLLAETRAAGSDLAAQEKADVALRGIFAQALGAAPAEMRYSGPGAMALESRAIIAADATRLSLLSGALILGILAWVYRSVALVAICALPAATGLLAGVVAVNIGFGSIHAITLGFGATLLGEAVDYPSYLLTQIKRGETVTQTLARILPTLRLAVLTTACGALALLMTDFTGLAQLGLLTMAGVLVAGSVTRWVVPSLVPTHWQPALSTQRPSVTARLSVSWTVRALVIALIVIIVAFASQRRWWDDDLANASPLPTALKERDRQLRESLGAPDVRFSLVLTGATQEEVLRAAEQLRSELVLWVASRDVDRFELVSDYLPSMATQVSRRVALPAPDRLRTNLADAIGGLPFRVESFAPFLASVEEARQASPLTPEQLLGTAFGVKVDALLSHDGGRWYVVVPLSGVRNAAALAAKAAASRVPGLRWVDLRAESAAMLAAYRGRTLMYTALGTLLIYGVLAYGLANWRFAARVLLPIVLALLVTAASLVAAGQPISIFHLVALLLILGIGINYALFFARAVETRDEHSRTLRTLAVVSGTTVSAFGVLAFSRTPVLHAIGSTVCLGVLLSLMMSALFLSPSRIAGESAP